MFLRWKQLSAEDCTREKIAIGDGIYGKVKRETQKNCAIRESKQTLAYREGSSMEQSREPLPGALAPPQLCLEGRLVELAPEEPRTRIRN